MRLTRSKLDYHARAMLPKNIKPHGVGNTSIIYLFENHADVYTTELAKCEWLQHLGIIEEYSCVGCASYEGYQSNAYGSKWVRNTVDVYYYRAPLWQQPTGKQLTEARRLTKKIRAAMWSAPHPYNAPESERIALKWEAIEAADIHPDVNEAARFQRDYCNLHADAGLSDWAIIGGELRWVDPFHDAQLGKDTISLTKNDPHRFSRY
jgi:hypothetical protein